MATPTGQDLETAQSAMNEPINWNVLTTRYEYTARTKAAAQLIADERERVFEKAFALLSEAYDFGKNRPAFIYRLRMMCGDYSEEDAAKAKAPEQPGEKAKPEDCYECTEKCVGEACDVYREQVKPVDKGRS